MSAATSSQVVVSGIVWGALDAHEVQFALDVDREHLLRIPGDVIDTIEEVDSIRYDGAPVTRVRLTFVAADHPLAHALAQVAAGYERALLKVSRGLLPAMAETATEASDACMRCIENCQQTVMPSKSDPFAVLVCMLSCTDCPG